jgi:hypothetical protein
VFSAKTEKERDRPPWRMEAAGVISNSMCDLNMQESDSSSEESMAPKEVYRYYIPSRKGVTSVFLTSQLENSGLDLERVAQDFNNQKRPTVDREISNCTIYTLRFIYYDVSSPLPTFSLLHIFFVF